MPTYKIDGLGLEKPRVVEAPNPASARQHVAASLTVRKIEVSEAFALANDGVRLEKAGTVEPEPDEPVKEQADPDRLREDRDERRALAAEYEDAGEP